MLQFIHFTEFLNQSIYTAFFAIDQYNTLFEFCPDE